MEVIEEVIDTNLSNFVLQSKLTLGALSFEENAQPPDVKKAWEYREAHMIRVKVNDKLSQAPICKTKLSQLGEYGIGMELYFLSIKQLGIVFLVIALISIWPMYENYNGEGLSDGDKKQAWDSLTLANQYTYDYEMTKTEAENQVVSYKNSKIRLLIADLLYTLIFVFFVVGVHLTSKEKIQSNSKKSVTAADYAVEISGFPCEAIKNDEVKDLFSKFGEVIEVYLARKYNGMLGSYKKRADLTIEQKYLERQSSNGIKVDKQLVKVKKEISKFDEKIRSQENNFKIHDDLPVIKGYVVFSKLSERADCLKAYKKANRACFRYPSSLKFRSIHKLNVTFTSEPSNINWENLEYSPCKRFLRQIFAVIIACIVLVATIVVVYLMRSFDDGLPSNEKCITDYQINKSYSLDKAENLYTSDNQKYCYCSLQTFQDVLSVSSLRSYCSYYIQQRTYGITIRFLVCAGVVMINFFLKILFRILGRFEHVVSKSKEQVKIMTKVFVAMFINTALIVLVVNANFSSIGFFGTLPFGQYIFNSKFSDFTRDWYIQVGSTLTITMIVSVFSPHMLNFILFYPRGGCKRMCYKGYKTQKEINAAFTGPEFDIATRYSQILNVVFSSMLYSGGIPLLNATCCATMFALYWTDKFLVLRHYSRPPRYSQELNDRFLAILPLAAILHSGFSLYMLGTEDIFPERFYTEGGFLYSYQNSIYDRIVSISGLIYLGMIAVSLGAFLYITSSNWFFSCSFKGKKSAKVVPEKEESEKTFYDDLEYIKDHGLHSFNILSNPIYHELIVSMNDSVKEAKVKIAKSLSESKDYLLEMENENT